MLMYHPIICTVFSILSMNAYPGTHPSTLNPFKEQPKNRPHFLFLLSGTCLIWHKIMGYKLVYRQIRIEIWLWMINVTKRNVFCNEQFFGQFKSFRTLYWHPPTHLNRFVERIEKTARIIGRSLRSKGRHQKFR